MIRRGVVSLNHHAARLRVAPERHAGSPPTGMASLFYGLVRCARARSSYLEHFGWTPSTAWATA